MASKLLAVLNRIGEQDDGKSPRDRIIEACWEAEEAGHDYEEIETALEQTLAIWRGDYE